MYDTYLLKAERQHFQHLWQLLIGYRKTFVPRSERKPNYTCSSVCVRYDLCLWASKGYQSKILTGNWECRISHAVTTRKSAVWGTADKPASGIWLVLTWNKSDHLRWSFWEKTISAFSRNWHFHVSISKCNVTIDRLLGNILVCLK